MDRLQLSIATEYRHGFAEATQEIRLAVNGRDLADIARDVEREVGADRKLAGKYRPLAEPHFQAGRNRLKDHLLGAARSSLSAGPADKTVMLVCADCGEPACWPLMARIEVEEKTVTWTDFEQPKRPEWDLSGLGPFEFDRKQYEGALADAATSLTADRWRDSQT